VLFQCHRKNCGFQNMTKARPGCVALCGDSRAGKTCLFRAIQNAPFTDAYEPTVLADHHRLVDPNLALPTVPELNFWDTGGDSQNQNFVKVYLRRTDVILVVTESISAPRLKSWCDVAIAANGGEREPTIAIVRSQKDVQFSPEEDTALQNFTRQRHCDGFVVSAKTGEGVPELIRKLFDICQERKAHPPAMLPEAAAVVQEVGCHCAVA
jgi:GTPase SAR1 family protein